MQIWMQELIGKGRCDDGFIWNPSTCECEYDKSCDIGEYLNYENFKCWKILIDKLVLQCEDESLNTIPLNATDTVSTANKNYCLIYIILLTIMYLILLAIVSVSCYYYYTKYCLKKRMSNAILNI